MVFVTILLGYLRPLRNLCISKDMAILSTTRNLGLTMLMVIPATAVEQNATDAPDGVAAEGATAGADGCRYVLYFLANWEQGWGCRSLHHVGWVWMLGCCC